MKGEKLGLLLNRYLKKSVIYFLPFTAFVYFIYCSYVNSYERMTTCVFCNIIAGKNETKVEKETESFVIFKDIKPASTYHYLAVPKKHVESLETMTKDDIATIVTLETGLKDFFKSKNISLSDALFGFHMPPFITVNHLHLHGIAPQNQMSFITRLVFKPHSFWFKQVEEAKKYLQKNPKTKINSGVVVVSYVYKIKISQFVSLV